MKYSVTVLGHKLEVPANLKIPVRQRYYLYGRQVAEILEGISEEPTPASWFWDELNSVRLAQHKMQAFRFYANEISKDTPLRFLANNRGFYVTKDRDMIQRESHRYVSEVKVRAVNHNTSFTYKYASETTPLFLSVDESLANAS
jgi:predicted RNA-binding protein YlxR (DUF448 family)